MYCNLTIGFGKRVHHLILKSKVVEVSNIASDSSQKFLC